MSASRQVAKAVREPVDRRVARTRHGIDQAFLRLLERHQYDAVSVSDIVREADVGRATFYEHYTSKDDLLRAQLRHVAGSLLVLKGDAQEVIDATPLLRHVRDVPVLYRLVAGRSATSRSLRVLRQVLEERIGALLEQRTGAGATLPPPWTPSVATRTIVAGLCALLEWWADQGMQPAIEEVQALFQCASTPMLGCEGLTAR